MFAVLKTGGKQYKVSSGDILTVEKLAAVAGETVQFNEILMVDDRIGEPFVKDAGVKAEVIDQIKDKKVIHFVKRRRKHGSKRTKGHRQQLTLLRITEILAKGAAKSGIKAALGAGSVKRDPVVAEATVVSAPKKGQKTAASSGKTQASAKAKPAPKATKPEKASTAKTTKAADAPKTSQKAAAQAGKAKTSTKTKPAAKPSKTQKAPAAKADSAAKTSKKAATQPSKAKKAPAKAKPAAKSSKPRKAPAKKKD